MSIYPNLAKEFVNLNWETLDKLKACHYQVFNLNKQLIKKTLFPKTKADQRSMSEIIEIEFM